MEGFMEPIPIKLCSKCGRPMDVKLHDYPQFLSYLCQAEEYREHKWKNGHENGIGEWVLVDLRNVEEKQKTYPFNGPI